jgi:hypothetical protein
MKVMPGDDDGGAGLAQAADGVLGELLNGLEFDVDNLESGLGGFEQDFERGVVGAVELAAVLFAATGGDGGGCAVVCEKLLEARQSGERLGEVVETKFDEGGLFEDFGGLLDHLLGGGAGDGDADFSEAGAKEVGGDLSVCIHI